MANGPEQWLIQYFPALHRGEYADPNGKYMDWADLSLGFLKDRGSRNWGPMALAYRARIHDDRAVWEAWLTFLEHELDGQRADSDWSGRYGGFEFPSRLKWAWVVFSVHSVFVFLTQNPHHAAPDVARLKRKVRGLARRYLRAAYAFCSLVAVPYSFTTNRHGHPVRWGATVQQAGPRSQAFTDVSQELDDLFCLATGWPTWRYARGWTASWWIRESVEAVGRQRWAAGWARGWGRKQCRDLVVGAHARRPPARAWRWALAQLRGVKGWGGTTHVLRRVDGTTVCWWGGWNQFSRPVAVRWGTPEGWFHDFPYDDKPFDEWPRRYRPLGLNVGKDLPTGRINFESSYAGPDDYNWQKLWSIPPENVLYHVELGERGVRVWGGPGPAKASFWERIRNVVRETMEKAR